MPKPGTWSRFDAEPGLRSRGFLTELVALPRWFWLLGAVNWIAAGLIVGFAVGFLVSRG